MHNKRIRFFSACLMLISLLVLSGCGNGYDRKIIGSWLRDDGTMRFEFTADGKVTVEDFMVDYRVTGDYRITDAILKTKSSYVSWSEAQQDTISFEGDDVLIFHHVYDESVKDYIDVRYLRQP